MVSELLDHALSLDTRTVRTIRPLILVPGEVTRAYLAGRRVRYLPPLRAYLIAALMFFGLFSVFPRGPSTVTIVDMGSPEERAAQGEGAGRFTFSVPPRVPLFDADYQKALARARREPQVFARASYAMVPRLFFLFLPLFALFLELFYRRQGYYFDHLVFSLYYHAFAFLSFSILFLIEQSNAWVPTYVSRPVAFAVVAWLLLYLPIALRRVYGGSWPMTLMKVAGLGVVYFGSAGIIGGPLMVAGAFLTF